MDQYKTDFHIHTTYSDGMETPASIVRQAKELEFDMIAITDHDGVDGAKEAMIAGEAAGVKVIPGIELATETKDGTGLHILGYYIDPDNELLRKEIQLLRESRRERNVKLVEVLRDMGFDISISELTGPDESKYIGKPVIARALAAKGYIKKAEDAFQEGKFLNSEAAKAVKRNKTDTEKAIGIIKAAGGIAVLAHPIQTKGKGKPGSEEFYENMGKLVAELKKAGLGGIECYHPDQNHEQTMKFIEIAEKYHLHITKGSDFHGDDFAQAAFSKE